MNKNILFRSAAAAALALAFGGQLCALEKVNLNMADAPASLVIYIGMEKGYFKQEGLDLNIIPGSSFTSADKLNSLVSGVVDVFRMSYHTSMGELMPSANFRIVADAQRQVKGLARPSYFLVRKDLAGTVRTWGDLKGRTIASYSPASPMQIDVLRSLEKAGLSEKDLTIKNVAFGLRAGLLIAGELDVCMFLEPVAGQLVRMGVAEVFENSSIAESDSEVALMFYSGRFRKNKKSAQGFMNAYLRAVRDFQAMPMAEQQKIAGKYFPFPVDASSLAALHVGTDAAVDTAYLSGIQDYALAAGMIKKKTGPEQMYDFSWLAAARKALPAK
ncbi:MAG: hypothetical protein A2285_00200 [Elusimicrobia bacterium RIFOXYA12_FULL_57_11]|nr:MAG: hypothetical protein A2285_00200 [Elusimicrobia bacterium RIFOXYA12_FULL_57_11]